MIELVLGGLLLCPPIVFVNESENPWNDHDRKILRDNMRGCEKRYGKEAPCLKKFIKRPGFQVYRVICGLPE